jgi:hypothetical protein
MFLPPFKRVNRKPAILSKDNLSRGLRQKKMKVPDFELKNTVLSPQK